MSEDQTTCPKCSSEYCYQDGFIWICPECGNEFSKESEASTEPTVKEIKDANGNVLQDGDTVIVAKELKVKGASSIKAGTKVKNIKLDPEAADGHDISCKIPGFGAMGLKSEFVKKV